MQCDELRHDREANAASRDGRIHRALETLIRLPDPVAILRRNSRSLVVHDDPRALTGAAHRDRDRLA
jgi:hypothetical protein